MGAPDSIASGTRGRRSAVARKASSRKRLMHDDISAECWDSQAGLFW